jgi:hypothetical protein
MKQLLVLLICFYSGTTLASAWGDYIIKNVINKQQGGLAHFFDRTDALQLPWKFDEQEFGVNGSEDPPSYFQRKPFACRKNNKLWPTHPQQETKHYHFAVYATYNHAKKLDPTNAMICAQPNSKKNPTKCMRGTVAKVVVMSDLYQDECGNIYRGFWPIFFTVGSRYFETGTENMGTLASKGRWFTVDDEGDHFRLAATYSLTKSDFMFLVEPSPHDEADIREKRQRALRVVKMRGLQFLDQPQ